MGKPAQSVEVTEEFVSAVDEVHDHFVVTLDIMESRASPKQFRVRRSLFPEGGRVGVNQGVDLSAEKPLAPKTSLCYLLSASEAREDLR